jgi:hypothetical protein
MIPFMIDSLQKINQIKSNQNLSIKSLETENKELTQKLNMEKDKIRNLEKENLEIRKLLGELQKENADFKLSVMQQLKEIQENRYAKK